MQANSVIDFVGVQKSYDGETLVVKNLNLSIVRGEFLTLLGASGSGKTTTLMMLAGFEAPTHGVIRMNGRPIEAVPAHKRGIGMVFQNYALFPHMTVEQNLAYPLRMRGATRAEVDRNVKRAVDMVRLHGMQHRRPSELSGGQQQRVALARAMVFEPEVILMDEPLGALDKNLREHMQYEIKQLHRQLGVTIVYVTHDQGEALTMSDRVAVFHEGAIAQIGAPADLYERPASASVAGFIGENNRLHAKITTDGDGKPSIVLESGLRLTLPRSYSRTDGSDSVDVLVRPERIVLGTDASQEGWQQLQGTVADLSYLGDHLRVHLVTSTGDRFVAKVANTTQAAKSGDRVTFGWAVADTHLFVSPPRVGSL